MNAAPDDPYRAPTEVEFTGDYPATACPACKTPVRSLRSCLQGDPGSEVVNASFVRKPWDSASRLA